MGNRNGGMRHWLVPIEIETGAGKKQRKTVFIRANVDEWQAQNLASIKVRWKKQFNRYVRNLTVAVLKIDHAIEFKTKKCNWGCCQLGK